MIYLIRASTFLVLLMIYKFIYYKYENIIAPHGLIAISIFAVIFGLSIGLVDKMWLKYKGKNGKS